VLRSVELHFEYQKLGSTRFEQRRVNPYHIASLENQWYLFAEDLDRKQLRTFALPRMRNARATSTRFRRPADFSISKVLSGSFGVHSGGKKQRIRLQFDPFAGRLVSERTWHESQQIKTARDGSITMQLELGGLEEIQRWILSWGSHVRVLEPKELAQRVGAEAQAVAALYA
jgi:proteasome accessory factor B